MSLKYQDTEKIMVDLSHTSHGWKMRSISNLSKAAYRLSPPWMPSPMTLELEGLLFRDVNLCHQQLEEMTCSGKQNQWIVRSDSRNKLLPSGEFLQIPRSQQLTYWPGNKYFHVCCNHYYWKVKDHFITCLSTYHIVLFIEINLAVTDLRSSLLVTKFAYEIC